MHWWDLNTNLFDDFQLSRKLFDMHWWDLKTNTFWRFAAIKNTYWHALVGPEHKIFSAIWSYQENLLNCIGGTLTQSLFVDFQQSRILIDMLWWDLKQVFFRDFQPSRLLIDMHWWDLNTNLFDDFQLSRILIYMHWWNLNTKSSRRFSAIKKTYGHRLAGL